MIARVVTLLVVATTLAHAEPQVVDLPRQYAVASTVKAKPAALAAELKKSYLALLVAAQDGGFRLVGPPFARYTSRGQGSEPTYTVEAGLPVAEKPAKLPTGIHLLVLPAGPAAIVVHKGPHAQLPAAHAELDAWMEKSHHTAAGARWEIYVTNPITQPDPDKQETKIVAPLAR